jgi:hypothetical protein
MSDNQSLVLFSYESAVILRDNEEQGQKKESFDKDFLSEADVDRIQAICS